MITPVAKALAESIVAEAMPEWDAQREYRRLDALAEQLKQEPQTPGVLADRPAVLLRKAEIFRHYFLPSEVKTPLTNGAHGVARPTGEAAR